MATAGAERLFGRLERAGRLVHAWWEGYAYDDLVKAPPSRDLSHDIAECIWGEGRIEPGDPSWTMRHARALGLSTRARVVVFGAGLGGPLRDLRTGAHWRATGYARVAANRRGARVKAYDFAQSRLNRAASDGGLCFFELSRDAEPAGFASFTSEFLRSGAPMAFADYAAARKGARLRSCFQNSDAGTPRTLSDTTRLLKDAGYLVGDVVDETRTFTQLVVRGWSRWRLAYDRMRALADARQRAEGLRLLASCAELWAERFDAMRAGHLQVVRIQARKAL